MKIRSVKGAVEEFKKIDESTAVNETMLWTLIDSGFIVSESLGKKTIIDADAVIKVLCEMTGCEDGEVPHIRTIRNAMTENRKLCSELGLSRDRVRECVAEDYIPSIRVGNRNYIATEAFQEPLVNAFFSHDRKSRRMKKSVSEKVTEQIQGILADKTAIKVFRRI